MAEIIDGYRLQWRRHSASRRGRMLWLVTASLTSSIPTRVRTHGLGLHRCARQPPHCDQHGPQGGLAAQRVRRRSVKYEEVYLRAYDSVREAHASICRYLDFYNGRRPHSSLDGTTPDQAYFNPLPVCHSALHDQAGQNNISIHGIS